jgi:hypothetical protein
MHKGGVGGVAGAKKKKSIHDKVGGSGTKINKDWLLIPGQIDQDVLMVTNDKCIHGSSKEEFDTQLSGWPMMPPLCQ